MADSYTLTDTFTVTHARHMAAKVATDLKRMQRFYGYPCDTEIAAYEAEITEFLKYGFLEHVTYGFKRNGDWIEPTLRYQARDLVGGPANDDDPGRVKTGCDVTGASFGSYLVRNFAWTIATPDSKEQFDKRLPYTRVGAPAPGVAGYLVKDRVYSSGGHALDRESVRSYS